MLCLKYLILKIGRLVRWIYSKWSIGLSYTLLIISFLIFLAILIPNCFDKVPVFSYFISEKKLPITYELCGEVRVLDDTGNLLNKNVEVFVGGYSTYLESTEFNLKFTSPITNELFVVIRYEMDGNMHEYTKLLEIRAGNHFIKEEFTINV